MHDGLSSNPLIWIPSMLLVLSFAVPLGRISDVLVNLFGCINIDIPDVSGNRFFVAFSLMVLLIYGTYFICNIYTKKKQCKKDKMS